MADILRDDLDDVEELLAAFGDATEIRGWAVPAWPIIAAFFVVLMLVVR